MRTVCRHDTAFMYTACRHYIHFMHTCYTLILYAHILHTTSLLSYVSAGFQPKECTTAGLPTGLICTHFTHYKFTKLRFGGLPAERVYHSRTSHWVELLESI
jgi:hypothetical protein